MSNTSNHYEEEEEEKFIPYGTPPRDNLESTAMMPSSATKAYGLSQSPYMRSPPNFSPPPLTPNAAKAVFQFPLAPDGSKANPYVHMMNFIYPERNLFFDIHFVEKMKDTNFHRNGIVIRMTVAVEDFKNWDAWVPSPDMVPEKYRIILHRLVLIRGPSIDFFRKNSQRFQNSLKKKCEAMLNAHKTTQAAINDTTSDEREWSYYLFVAPENVTLDNTIFSKGDMYRIKREAVGIKLSADESRFKEEIKAMDLLWQIADRFAFTRIDEDAEDSDNEDNIFG